MPSAFTVMTGTQLLHEYVPSLSMYMSGFFGICAELTSAFHVPSNALCANAELETSNASTPPAVKMLFMISPINLMQRPNGRAGQRYHSASWRTGRSALTKIHVLGIVPSPCIWAKRALGSGAPLLLWSRQKRSRPVGGFLLECCACRYQRRRQRGGRACQPGRQ